MFKRASSGLSPGEHRPLWRMYSISIYICLCWLYKIVMLGTVKTGRCRPCKNRLFCNSLSTECLGSSLHACHSRESASWANFSDRQTDRQRRITIVEPVWNDIEADSSQSNTDTLPVTQQCNYMHTVPTRNGGRCTELSVTNSTALNTKRTAALARLWLGRCCYWRQLGTIPENRASCTSKNTTNNKILDGNRYTHAGTCGDCEMCWVASRMMFYNSPVPSALNNAQVLPRTSAIFTHIGDFHAHRRFSVFQVFNIACNRKLYWSGCGCSSGPVCFLERRCVGLYLPFRSLVPHSFHKSGAISYAKCPIWWVPYFPDYKSHLFTRMFAPKKKGVRLKIEIFVELIVRHAFACILYTKSHVQTSPHLVKGYYWHEMMAARIQGVTCNRGNTVRDT